jgi:hypothetical protein
MTTNAFKQVIDFIIKMIMVFTTIVALVFFAGYYPQFSFTFGFLALIFILAMMTKGLLDIFQKD